jgi:hypothetical protein
MRLFLFFFDILTKYPGHESLKSTRSVLYLSLVTRGRKGGEFGHCRLQLLIEGDEPAAALLRQTVAAHRELLTWLEAEVPAEHGDNLVALHRHFYEAARRESGLQARAVTLAFKDFVQRRRGKIPVGIWWEGAPLDEKLYGLKGIELVSIATLKGRVTIPFRVAGYGAEWNGKSPARLVVSRVDARDGKSARSHPHPNPPPKTGEGADQGPPPKTREGDDEGPSPKTGKGEKEGPRLKTGEGEERRSSPKSGEGNLGLLIAVSLSVVEGVAASG